MRSITFCDTRTGSLSGNDWVWLVGGKVDHDISVRSGQCGLRIAEISIPIDRLYTMRLIHPPVEFCDLVVFNRSMTRVHTLLWERQVGKWE